MTDFFSNAVATAQTTPELERDLHVWSTKLALLRGDNIYDVTRLYFSSQAVHTCQQRLEIAIPAGMKADENDKRVLKMFEEEILPSFGLFFIRTIMGRLICTKDAIVGALVNPSGSISTANYDLLGTSVLVEKLTERFKEVAPFTRTPTMTRLSVNGDGSLFTTVELVPARKEIPDLSLFYPYLDRQADELWDSFRASDSNILLLIGPPGTGKSNLINNMMWHRGFDDKINMADRDDAVSHPGLSDHIRSLVDGSVMITEDSDRLVGSKREDGNANMSALLNTTEGIVSRDVKTIISTNLSSINKVDEALVRPGRCFDIITFQYLTRDQAYAVREMMGKESVNIPEETLSLALALNYSERRAGRATASAPGFRKTAA